MSGFRGLRCVNQKEHFSFRLAHILTRISISFLRIHQFKKQILRHTYSIANSKTSQESGSSGKKCRELQRQKGQDKRSSVVLCGEGPVPLWHPHGVIFHKVEKFSNKGGKALRGSLAAQCCGAVRAKKKKGRQNLQGPGRGQTVKRNKARGKGSGSQRKQNRQGALFTLPSGWKHSALATENMILFYLREYLFRWRLN